MDNFIAGQRKIHSISDENAALLFRYIDEVDIPKGAIAVREGQRDHSIYFVKKGLVRAYVLRDGKDITLWFAAEGEMAAAVVRSVSIVNIEVMENTVLFRIPQERLESLFEQSLELANWGRKLMENYLSEYEHYFTNYSWTSAREQYERLMKEYPDLFRKVPLKHIASYLQITPQSLSRIRGKK